MSGKPKAEAYFGRTRLEVGKDQAHEDLLPLVVQSYANALHHGTGHIYQVSRHIPPEKPCDGCRMRALLPQTLNP